MSDAALRIQLEGRVERLEATRVRYRELVAALGDLRWTARRLRVSATLREAVGSEAEVEQTLAHIRRRLALEGVVASRSLRALIDEVESLRVTLLDLARRRVGDGDTGGDLAERLTALEALVTGRPRHRLARRHLTAAERALPLASPEVTRLRRFGAALERLVARPSSPAQLLPASLHEWLALERQWPDGLDALRCAWARVALHDETGAVARALRRLATRAPSEPPLTGPQHLAHAEYWTAQALARIERDVRAHTHPVRPTSDRERFAVMRWLLARAEDPEARLQDASMTTARAGLIELAHSLALAPTDARAWRRRREWAAHADANPADEDWHRVREALRHRVQTPSPSGALPPLYRALGAKPAGGDAAPPAATLLTLTQALEAQATRAARPRRR